MKFALALLCGLMVLLSVVSPVWAAECLYKCCEYGECYGKNFGPKGCLGDQLCCESCMQRKEDGGITNPVIGIFGTQHGNITITTLLATFLRLSLTIAGILLLFYLIWGGITWLTSGGEKAKMAQAKDRITNALAGLVLIVLVLVIIAIVNEVFKLNILQPEIPTP